MASMFITIFQHLKVCLPIASTYLSPSEEGDSYELRMTLQRNFSLVVQWLRLCTASARGLGSIPDQRTRFCTAQLKKDYITGRSFQMSK